MISTLVVDGETYFLIDMFICANTPNLSMLEDTNAGIGCTQVNSHSVVLTHFDGL